MRKLAGEPASATSDLQYPAASQIGMTLNETDLHPGRRIVRILVDSCHRGDAIAKRTSLRSGGHRGESSRSQTKAWT
jgi:hypothetical protein